MNVQIVGLDRVRRSMAISVKPALRAITKAVAAQVQGEIAPYPPASAANRPGGPGSRWYERGYGSRWRRMDGSIGGRPTSETLGRRWSISGWGGIGAVVRNIASYSIYVHDHGYRAWFHKRRGWVSDKEAVDKVMSSGVVDRIVDAALVRLLRG